MPSTAQRQSREASSNGWKAMFRLVFERSSNPIILLDDARLVLDANSAALALVGRGRAEMVGTSIVDSIRPSERARAARDWQGFLRSGSYSGTRDLQRADGSEVPVSFAARLVEIDGRRLAVYVVEEGPGGPVPQAVVRLRLTPREREIVTLIALGLDSDEIAAELHISRATVRTHVRNAMARLGAHTRAQLVATVISGEHLVEVAKLSGKT